MNNASDVFLYRNDPWTILLPVVNRLSREHLLWSDDGKLNGIGWLFNHVSSTEDYWVNEIAFKDKLVSSDAGAADLPALLARHLQVREATEQRLHALTVNDLKRTIEVPVFGDGWKPLHPPTLHWVFNHVFTHEAYHIGHLVTLMRLQGLADPSF